MSKKFIKALQRADSEKLVEAAYQHYITEELLKIGAEVEHFQTVYQTDGLLDGKFIFNEREVYFKLLLEVKFDEDFSKRVNRTKVLIQCIYYLKQIELAGERVPDVLLVGDRNECFTLDSRYVLEYLDKQLDWSIAPSQAANAKENIEFFNEIEQNGKLHEKMYVHHINDKFDLVHVADEIKAISCKEPIKRRITSNNITRVFEYFVFKVLARKTSGESLYKPREQVEFFMQLILNNENCYAHPKKRIIAMINDKEVRVNGDAFTSFNNYYFFKYNAVEKKELTEIADRLIEDSDRRRRGDFYTNSNWSSAAHLMLDEELGNDWKEKYMVWDCAWGTGNLTRDYKFKELYASTLFQHDIDTGVNYNRNATKFQYDFLNDDVELFESLRIKKESGIQLIEEDFKESKLYYFAHGLIKGLLEGKLLLFLINPPYGTANNLNAKIVGGSKEGIAKTKINELMKMEKVGASSQQLYAQFIYRINSIMKLFQNDGVLGMFSPSLFLTSSTFKGLRKLLSENCHFKNGFLFKASHFADVSDNWGINFTVFGWNEAKYLLDCKLILKDVAVNDVVSVGEKKLYNLDGVKTCSDWIKEDIRKIKTEDAPQLSTGINIKEKGVGSLIKNSLGYYVNGANSVYKNPTDVFILSSTSSMGHGISILPINFNRVVSNFTARKLILPNWANSKDEYMIPNTEHPSYKQWEKDSIIYSLFHSSSNQSSLRNIQYKDKKWDIYNHFFFMSKQDIEDLALGDYSNDNVYMDIEDHADNERYVYTLIQDILDNMKLAEKAKEILATETFDDSEENKNRKKELETQAAYIGFSPKALAVYHRACELVKSSFAYRSRFAASNPEYHIESWDAGWYQVKGLLKEFMKEDLEAFNKLYKTFEDKLRPLVYELGFLYK